MKVCRKTGWIVWGLMGLAAAAWAATPRVYQKEGAVYYEGQGGEAVRIASEGGNREPVLSSDGKTIVFLKKSRDLPSADGTPPSLSKKMLADEIWLADSASGRSRLLIDEVPGLTKSYPAGSFGVERGSLQFAPDSNSFYFLAKGIHDSDGIVYRVDLRSLKVRALTRGRELRVIPAGKCVGYLLVRQRRFFVDGGSYDWSWMYDAEGKEIGPFQGDFVEISKEEFCVVSPPGVS